MVKVPVSALDFYADTIRILRQASIRFLVGGAYALREYTGVARDTKDFDIFVAPRDVDRTLAALRQHGYHGEIAFSHWLAKVHFAESFIDIIFRAGNGLCEVDELWFRGKRLHRLLGKRVALVPPEEMIWQKAYIMERERFDGADIAHLVRFCAREIDWEHLLWRFGDDWRVLASHLLLFGFIYPSEGHLIPSRVMSRIAGEFSKESHQIESNGHVCQGTLVSRVQYLPDIERWGYRDARKLRGTITAEEIEAWTNAAT
jgi:hypothetical protein